VKFAFDFSIKLIFRLIFPGMVLAAAMVPAGDALLNGIGVPLKVAYSYPFQVVAWGWLIAVCDMRIYMLFEGRRYWPYPIRWCLKKFQQIRLNGLLNVISNPKADSRRITEARVEYAQYPVSDYGDPYVAFPTRLGNLIEAYENIQK